jgi:hypothetical protein
MKTLIFLGMVLFPCMAIAATDCRTVEYPDHTEVTCVGDAAQAPASAQIDGQKPSSGATLSPDTLAAVQEPDVVASAETEYPDVPAENIVRNGLARAFGETVLRNNLHGRW